MQVVGYQVTFQVTPLYGGPQNREGIYSVRFTPKVKVRAEG